jgi:nucleoside-diphosphate-sugar epimerase
MAEINVLILGGSGFLGENITRSLLELGRKDIQVQIADKELATWRDDSVRIVSHDFLREGALRSILSSVKPNVIIHAAGSDNNGSYYKEVVGNSVITAGLCDAIKATGFSGRVLYISSTSVTPGPYMPAPHLSGMSHIFSEEMLLKTSIELGGPNRLPVCRLRIPFVYGYRRKAHKDFFNDAIEKILLGGDIVSASKDTKINILHIRDFCHLVLSLLREKSHEKFSNVWYLSGSVVTMEKLFEVVTGVIGYGNVAFMDAMASVVYDINDADTMKNWKIKKTRFSKKTVSEIVELRKQNLVKRGYTEHA